jgi:hypothetical protein
MKMIRISSPELRLMLGACTQFAIFFLVGCQHSPSAAPAVTSRHKDVRTATANVVPRFFSIKQGEFAAFRVLVAADATNAHIEGQFSAEPRPYAQVDMLLIRETGYQAWRTYPNDAVIYHTGNTSADKFRLPLTSGNYYLVFDNNLPAEAVNSGGAWVYDHQTARLVPGTDASRLVDAKIRLIYDQHF